MKKSNRQILKILSVVFVIAFLSMACKSDDDATVVEEEGIELPVSGTYSWSFEIPNMGTQVSTHIFTNESITYKMEGSAYSNEYRMIPEFYDATEKRLIAVGEGGTAPQIKDGVYFVVFFKEITDTTVKIYKRECENKEEAYSFAYPSDDTTEDHGWNVYTKE